MCLDEQGLLFAPWMERTGHDSSGCTWPPLSSVVLLGIVPALPEGALAMRPDQSSIILGFLRIFCACSMVPGWSLRSCGVRTASMPSCDRIAVSPPWRTLRSVCTETPGLKIGSRLVREDTVLSV